MGVRSYKQQCPRHIAEACYKLVGAAGFEPTTSPTRTVHATSLRYAPKIKAD